MSNVCKTCNQTISWDPEVRKTLGIRGPINPDGSIHRCMGIHKQEVVPEPTMPISTVPTASEVDISTSSSSASPTVAKVYPYEVKLEQCSPGIRITVHARNEDPDFVMKQAIDLYRQTKARLEAAGERVAPVGGGEVK